MRDSSKELNFQYFTFQREERNRKSSFYECVPVFSLLWWDTREHQLKEGGFVWLILPEHSALPQRKQENVSVSQLVTFIWPQEAEINQLPSQFINAAAQLIFLSCSF